MWDVFTTTTQDSVSSINLKFWKRVFVATKIIFSIILFFIVLGATVVNKLCFIIMTANVFPATSENFTALKTASNSLSYDATFTDVKWIWAIMMTMGTPYIFIILSSIWRLCMSKSSKRIQLPVLLWVQYFSFTR